MGHSNFQPPISSSRAAPGRSDSGTRVDMRARLLQGLQEFFELSRDQFDDDDLVIPEWRQADDALEHAYDACAARAAIPTIKHLCTVTRRCIDIAVEMSMARSFYDGRI